MKLQTTIFLLLFAASLSAQGAQAPAPEPTFTYSLDLVARDSFFLVEEITYAPTTQNPRPTVSKSQMLFHTEAELSKFITSLNEGSAKAEAESVAKAKLSKTAAITAQKIAIVRDANAAFFKQKE